MPELKHGNITDQNTRAKVCIKLGLIENWHAVEMEGGKNFPLHDEGPFPEPYQSDNVSAKPPLDGYILSGGKTDARDVVNYTDKEMSDKLGTKFSWKDHTIPVKSGETFAMEWGYHAEHKTRGYEYHITKENVNPDKRIARDDLELLAQDFYTETPYWSHELPTKKHVSVELPENKTGHHLLLAIWKVADTGMGFFQALDLDFGTELVGDNSVTTGEVI